MMRIFILLFFPVFVFTQTDVDSIPEKGLPLITLKTNLTGHLNLSRQSFSVISDIRFARRWSADVGIGYFYRSSFHANQAGEYYLGPKVRAGLKYYWFKRWNQDVQSHIGIETKLHFIDNRRYLNLRRQGGEYVETKLVKRHLQTTGAAIRYGKHFYFNEKRRFFMDISIALGVERLYISHSDIPADAEVVAPGGQIFVIQELDPGIHWQGDLYYTFHLGYSFW